MISLQAGRPPEPAEFAPLVCAAQLAIETRVASGTKLDEQDFENHWSAFKHRFYEPQHHKCAYCECVITDGTFGDVEHFRPVAYVQPCVKRGQPDDTGGKPPRRTMGKADRPGYWWLAYNWSNYLLSCNKCNSVWKKNQFPVSGPRAQKPGQEAAEKRLLLNPYEDDPQPHFSFDPLGAIAGRTPQGTETMAVCGLDRYSLANQRLVKAEKVTRFIGDYSDALTTNNDFARRAALRSMLAECQPRQAQAGMARFLVHAGIGLSYGELLRLQAAGEI